MGWLDRFSPGQRQALTIGGPAVAGLVIVTKLWGRARTPRQPVAATGPGTPSTDAIGVGQLSDFESHVADQINTLAMLIAQRPAPAQPAPHRPPPPAHDNTRAVPVAPPPVAAAVAAQSHPQAQTAAAPAAPSWPADPFPGVNDSPPPAAWADVPPGWYDSIGKQLW